MKTPLNVDFPKTVVTNLPFPLQILVSINEKELNTEIWCLQDIYLQKEWLDSGDLKVRKNN